MLVHTSHVFLSRQQSMAAIFVAAQNRLRWRRVQNAPRIYNVRPNHFQTMTDDALLRKYRMDRAGIEYLCQELQDDLVRPTRRSNALSVSTEVLA